MCRYGVLQREYYCAVSFEFRNDEEIHYLLRFDLGFIYPCVLCFDSSISQKVYIATHLVVWTYTSSFPSIEWISHYTALGLRDPSSRGKSRSNRTECIFHASFEIKLSVAWPGL